MGFISIQARAAPKTQGTRDTGERFTLQPSCLGGRASSSLSFTQNKDTTMEQGRNWFSLGAGAMTCHFMPSRMAHLLVGMSFKQALHCKKGTEHVNFVIASISKLFQALPLSKQSSYASTRRSFIPPFEELLQQPPFLPALLIRSSSRRQRQQQPPLTAYRGGEAEALVMRI